MSKIKYSNQARHTAGASRTLRELSWRFFCSGKWHYFLLMLSDHGRNVMLRKYDAFVTDRAYEPNFSGLLGPIGGLIDRVIWHFPLHKALRERVQIVSSYLSQVAKELATTRGEIRVISAPCGLIKDLLCAKDKLTSLGVFLSRVQFVGLDLDLNGDVLPEARKRAADGGLELGLVKDDIFNIHRHYKDKFDVVNCIVGNSGRWSTGKTGLTYLR